MRILFFEHSSVWNYLLPEGFQEAGHEVKVSGHLEESGIPTVMDEFHPDLVMTMGWGMFQWANYQEWLAREIKKRNVPHIFWSLEDPEHTEIFTVPLLQKVKPDFVFTICNSKVTYFERLGFKTCYLDYGYNPRFHHPIEGSHEKPIEICVVANSYAHILEHNASAYRLQCLKALLCPLLRHNFKVDFWGENWDKMNQILGVEIPSESLHGYLPYAETNAIFNQSKIVLGFQNNFTQLTQRTYEILGSGSFLLTADTFAVRKLFVPGTDLIVSSSPYETIELVTHFLREDNARNQIAAQGYEKVKTHTYRNKAEKILTILKENHVI